MKPKKHYIGFPGCCPQPLKLQFTNEVSRVVWSEKHTHTHIQRPWLNLVKKKKQKKTIFEDHGSHQAINNFRITNRNKNTNSMKYVI